MGDPKILTDPKYHYFLSFLGQNKTSFPRTGSSILGGGKERRWGIYDGIFTIFQFWENLDPPRHIKLLPTCWGCFLNQLQHMWLEQVAWVSCLKLFFPPTYYVCSTISHYCTGDDFHKTGTAVPKCSAAVIQLLHSSCCICTEKSVKINN